MKKGELKVHLFWRKDQLHRQIALIVDTSYGYGQALVLNSDASIELVSRRQLEPLSKMAERRGSGRG